LSRRIKNELAEGNEKIKASINPHVLGGEGNACKGALSGMKREPGRKAPDREISIQSSDHPKVTVIQQDDGLFGGRKKNWSRSKNRNRGKSKKVFTKKWKGTSDTGEISRLEKLVFFQKGRGGEQGDPHHH